jgi:hypothetical protein
MSLTKILKKLDMKFSSEDLALPSNAFQQKYAPLLRRLAVDNLEKGSHPLCQAFRKNSLQALSTWLTLEKRARYWGSDDSARSLAQLLNFDLFIQNNNEPAYLAFESDKHSAKKIVLKNIYNSHWQNMLTKEATLGDGNCLFNAFAQSIQAILIQEQLYAKWHQAIKKSKAGSVRYQDRFFVTQERQIKLDEMYATALDQELNSYGCR